MAGCHLLIADDHTLLLDGLVAVLGQEPGFEVRTASDVDALEAALAGDPAVDLLVLDWCMPGLAPAALIHRLGQGPAPIPVIVLSGTGTAESVAAAALDAGALGFVHKAEALDQLAVAIHRVLAGELYLDANTAQAIAAHRRRQQHAKIYLTDRQRAVLQQLAEGCSNGDIARQLGIAETTVKTHVSAVMNALGADNRTACAHRARQLGLLSPPSI